MRRLELSFFCLFAAIPVLNVLWDDFPTLPVLYGCVTAASLLLGWCCLYSKAPPASRRAQSVPENVRMIWRQVLGVLFLINGALCPAGFLLWYFLHFDQDFILLTQMFGFLAICFASLIPLYRGGGTRG